MVSECLEHSVRVERIQTYLGPASLDVPGGERLLARTTVERRDMLLANSISTTPVQSFNLFTVCGLQRAKRSNITRLELV
jgi:hypothetical protein